MSCLIEFNVPSAYSRNIFLLTARTRIPRTCEIARALIILKDEDVVSSRNFKDNNGTVSFFATVQID